MKFTMILMLLLFLQLSHIDSKPIKPVIGIFGNSEPENGDEEYLNGTYYPISYIYWLESGGAEVMAIQYWYSFEEIDEILRKINGILFLGGGRDFSRNGTWETKARYVIEKSLNDSIPFWGTCQGFQLIGTLLSDNFTLLSVGIFKDHNVLHNLELTENGKKSDMFKFFTPYEFDLLENTNSTIYNHQSGFLPDEYNKDPKLKELTIVTSNALDTKGKEFINTFEGRKNKFYAVQFHPEKNPFKRIIKYYVEQNMEALIVSQKLLFNFIQDAKNNKNKFKEEEKDKYDFFDTYRGTKNAIYNKSIEQFFFYKREK